MLAQLINDVVNIWEKYSSLYFSGMLNTIILALVSTILGCLIGFGCGIIQTIPTYKNDNILKKGFVFLLKAIIRIYVEVFRGTPMVLQAVFIYYGLSYFTNNLVNFSNVWSCAIFVVSINTGAYMTETVRGGILSIDKGQSEGAKAIGMNHFQTMLHVVFPQTLRNILPQIGNNYIINIKDTSVMFIISFTELFAVHKSIAGATFQFFPSATIEMIAYLTLTLISSLLLRLWESNLTTEKSYQLASLDQLTATSGILNSPHKGSIFDERHIETDKGEK